MVSIEGLNNWDFTYILNSTASDFIINLSINKSITAGPILTYMLLLPDDIIFIENIVIVSNSATISLLDIINLTDTQKKAIESAKRQTITTQYVATSITYANTAIASGTPMLLQGMMLTKYIEIKYPPNVLEIFKQNTPILEIFFRFKFENCDEYRNILPKIYSHYGVSPYFLENNGDQICKNVAILFIVYLLTVIVERSSSISLILKLLNLIHSIVVWEMVLFFMLLFWQKFVFYTFSNILFYSTSSNGNINLGLASAFIFLESLFLLHLFLILNIIQSKRNYANPKINVIEAKQHAIFMDVLESPIEDSLRNDTKHLNGLPLHEESFLDKKISFNINDIDKSPIPLKPQNEKKSEGLKQTKISRDSSFTSDTGEKSLKIFNFYGSPTSSPSKFKKNAVMNDNELDFVESKPNAKRTSFEKFVNLFGKFKIYLTSWLVNLRVIRYLYFPEDHIKFLKQYEFMHLDITLGNIWQTHYVFFDYLRQTILSIFAVLFHFKPFPQIFLINLVNICFIIYYIVASPYKSKIIFFVCLISEFITESALFSAMILSILDLNEETKIETRLFFGWIIVGANLALLYWLCFSGVVKILLMIYEKRKSKKVGI